MHKIYLPKMINTWTFDENSRHNHFAYMWVRCLFSCCSVYYVFKQFLYFTFHRSFHHSHNSYLLTACWAHACPYTHVRVVCTSITTSSQQKNLLLYRKNARTSCYLIRLIRQYRSIGSTINSFIVWALKQIWFFAVICIKDFTVVAVGAFVADFFV